VYYSIVATSSQRVSLNAGYIGPVTASVLLEAGEDISMHEYMALDYAVLYNSPDVLRVLLEGQEIPLPTIIRLIQDALNSNQTEIVKILLAHGPGLRSRIIQRAVLNASVILDNLQLYQLVATDKSIDILINITDQGETAVSLAATHGSVNVLEAMLADPRIDPSSRNQAALRGACDAIQLGSIELLIADPRVDPRIDDQRPLILACQYGSSRLLRLLLADRRIDPADNNQYALVVACENYHAEVVEILLTDDRIDPRHREYEALNRAAMAHATECIQVFLQDPRVVVSHSDLFEIACAANNLPLVKRLIQDGFISMDRVKQDGLINAVVSGRVEVVEYLLSYPEISPAGLLKYTVQHGNVEAIRLFLADSRIEPRGADSNSLVEAVTRQQHDILRLLLRDGRFDPNADQGHSLEVAIEMDDLTSVQILLADKRVKANAHNNKAIKLADELGLDEIVARLRDYGARL
ncbi:Hypothetical protein POVR2_LOCUS337, partial [uncultured virus]